MKSSLETGTESEFLGAIPLVAGREIEARIVSPLIDVFGSEFGHDRVMEPASRVVMEIARNQGAHLAEKLGGRTLRHFSACLKA